MHSKSPHNPQALQHHLLNKALAVLPQALCRSEPEPQQVTFQLSAVCIAGMQNIFLISKSVSPTHTLCFIPCDLGIQSVNYTNNQTDILFENIIYTKWLQPQLFLRITDLWKSQALINLPLTHCEMQVHFQLLQVSIFPAVKQAHYQSIYQRIFKMTEKLFRVHKVLLTNAKLQLHSLNLDLDWDTEVPRHICILSFVLARTKCWNTELKLCIAAGVLGKTQPEIQKEER